MQFAETLLSCDDSDFERLLYDEVRTQALRICVPQGLQTSETLTTEPVGDSEFESNKSEYCALERKLFRSFEKFIAGQEVTENSEDSAECSKQLECYLRSLAPGEQGICGRIFQANEPTYYCRDCAVDATCVLCRGCFFNSGHIKHNYKISTSTGVGYCDCGDPEAWRSDAWCKLHANQSGDGENTHNKLTTIDDTDVKLKVELDHLRLRINSIPQDIVRRTGKLLKPLLKSAIFCLTDLIQGTSRLSNDRLSSRLRKGNTASERPSEGSDAGRQDVVDDLWSTDDGQIDYTQDDEDVWENWPPPLSHIPLVSPTEDAVSLGQDAWPKTAPRRRSVVSVQSRCFAQLERARTYHPRLFPPRTVRLASGRTAASRAYLALCYNNEYHNYEQVVKTLRRVLDCTSQQATHHAVLINCDGRSVLQMNVTSLQASNLASVLMRTSTSLSTRPLYCTAQHADVYSMELFFTLFIRWLRRFCDNVPSLRPVICHALLGHFPNDNVDKLNQSDEILPILPHGEIRHSLTWRSVRQEMLRLIMSVLLKDNFYRCVFAIEFTRSYSSLIQNHIYDDHLETDSLCGLSCQFYTVISLARQLLENNSILTRLLSRLTAAFEANSIALPNFYSQITNQNVPADIQEELTVGNLTTDTNVSWIGAVLDLLRRLNPFEWGSSTGAQLNNPALFSSSNINPANCVLPEPRVLSWQAGNTLARSWFHPFERLFCVIRDIDYILASLTNARPLANSMDRVSLSTDDDSSWWTEAARSSYIEYIRQLLHLLSFVQDMNGMQRETQNHVEEELEWASGFYIMSLLINLLGLTVQVASSDYKLYQLVLREVRQVFETRIGIMDRRFRIKPLTIDIKLSLSNEEQLDHLKSDSNNNDDSNNHTKLNFHSLGVTTEVKLVWSWLRNGFNFDDLGLLDQAFVNLLIERPLQVFAFCAQCDAKMWVRNGYAVQQSMTNIFSSSMRVELVDRDIQLLQIASCVLPPDEFIIRLIHKFHLGNYLKSETCMKEPGPGRVHAVEMLLRILLSCITNRSRPSIGCFTKDYYALDNKDTSNGYSNYLDNILLDTDSEFYYPNLINDVIHTLCLKSLSYSELLSALPYQSTNSLLLNVTIEQSDISHLHNNQFKESNKEITLDNKVQPGSSCSIDIGPRPVPPASVSRSANKRAIDQALPKILRRVAIQSSINNRTVFNLRPEFMAYRFNRFYWGYRHPEQTTAEANVSRCLKKWIQEQNDPDLKNLPIPPPAPRPLHKFVPSVYPGPLKLLRCVTFVRLIKRLLDIGYFHGTATTWWSYNLLELLLHLITVALYEDELEGSKTVSSCRLEISSRLEDNCITSRLLRILNSTYHDDHSDLIRWTLNHWNRIVQNITGDQSSRKSSTEPTKLSTSSVKQDRAEIARARRARMMARMKKMQNNFTDSLSQNEKAAYEGELMDIDSPALNEGDSQQTMQTDAVIPAIVQQCALGPTRSLGAASFLLKSSSLSTSGGGGAIASAADTVIVPNPELVTCNLCLEEVTEQAASRIVMAAHVCRSSVLSSQGIGWLEGPATMTVIKRLSRENDMLVTPQSLMSVDDSLPTQLNNSSFLSTGRNDDAEKDGYANELLPYLASAATTVAATCAGTSHMGLRLIPNLISGIRCFDSKMDTSSLKDVSMTGISSNTLYSGLIDQLLDNYHLLGQQETGESIVFDRWYPRPLVSSRDPIAEEGSFFTFCCHPMHATCKTKYARQLKGRVEDVNRRNSFTLAFDFRCPVCKCISTIDLPMLGPIYSNLPVEWLRLRLLLSSNHQLNQQPSVANNNANFQPLSSWLCSLARWLDMFSDSNDFILGPSFPLKDDDGGGAATSYGSVSDRLQKTTSGPHSLEDYTLWNFSNIVSSDNSLNCSSSTSSPSLDIGLDNCPPSAKLLAFSENYEAVSNLINAVVKRMKYSLILQDDDDDFNNKKDNTNKSTSKNTNNYGTSSNGNTNNNRNSLNPLSRQFWTSRRFSRRASEIDNATTSYSANNSNSTINGGSGLTSFLPSHSASLFVATNLFTFVQRLASLCQPTPLDSLVQRPTSRRAANTVVDSIPYIPNVINEENNDQVVAYIVADTDVQVNSYSSDDDDDNTTPPNPNVHLLVTQSEFSTSSTTGSLTSSYSGNPSNLTSKTTTTPNKNTEQSIGNLLQTIPYNSYSSLSETIEHFHLDFMSFYERLRTLGSSIPHTTGIVTRATTVNSPILSSSKVLQVSDHVTKTTEDFNHKIIVNSHNFAKNYLERVAQRARNVIWSAACEWRSLRHSVAYTLIASERSLRLHGCHANFFNGGLAERRIHGLEHLLSVSLTAHSRHAVVSRGCPLSCDTSDSKTFGHRYCWPQLKSHPVYWWWWSYCVPFDAVSKSQLKDIPNACRLNKPPTLLNIAVTAVNVAATEDACFLWRLLLPPLEKYAKSVNDTSSSEKLKYDTFSSISHMHSLHSTNNNAQSTSLLWDVDITFLFISLLHLRPGLEEFGLDNCQCTRLASEADANVTSESGAATLGAHILACDEGRIRQPIGDSHETHLLRLCYTALLVQSLLAWSPNMNCLDYLKQHNLISDLCTWNDICTESDNWNIPQLLDVWRLLRDLSGLPAPNLSTNGIDDDPAYVTHLTQSLGLFLRANCLPFLRVAAFIIHKITGVDVPADLRQPTSSQDSIDNMNEHSLLLTYLGLPPTPSDLLVLLSSSTSLSVELNPLNPVNQSNHQQINISMLSESLWLARLITSWCLTGRYSLSRQLYQSLCHRFVKSTNSLSSIDDIIPYPNKNLPRLIELPNEYTHLLLLAMDMDCHAEGRTHSDLSLCLVCGHLACLFCYGCRQFENNSNTNQSATLSPMLANYSSLNNNNNNNTAAGNINQEFAVYRMQAHSRRCHSGYCLLLRIHSCRVILLSDQARRITEIPAPYRDSFGETDPDLRRGNPLFLVESEYKRINELWINHQLASSTASELVTPSNLSFSL
ncbi:unnamed protein product [Heterobilharzia americana]|nr:unnamed protein product [Heterobilharzia americana]